MSGRLRYAGLAGTALIAAGGWLAGALPGPGPRTPAEALWGTGAGFRFGLLAYLVGLALLGAAWWRLGTALAVARRAAPHGDGDRPAEVSLRWLLVTGALWALPLLVAPPLGSRDVYAYACQGAVWWDGYDPYAVGAAGGACPWTDSVPELWQHATAPYGPVALVLSAVAVALARAVPVDAGGTLPVAVAGLRLAALAGAVLVAALAPRLARRCGVRPAVALWLGVLSPLVAVHVVGGAHNDAVVAGLVVAALALAAGRPVLAASNLAASNLAASGSVAPGPTVVSAPLRSALAAGSAGVLLGLAVAVKVTAVVALPFVAILTLTRQGGTRPGNGPPGPAGPPAVAGHWRYRDAAVVVLTALAAFAALSAGTGLGTGWVSALAGTGALAQWTSPPTGLGMALGYVLRAAGLPHGYDIAVAVARGAGLAVLAAVSGALLARAWQRRGDAGAVVRYCGATLAAVVLLGPVVYPWYALVPLAVLACAVAAPRTRWWLAVATLVLTALVTPSGLGLAVVTKFPGAMLVAAATIAAAWRLARWRRARAAAPAQVAVPPSRPGAATSAGGSTAPDSPATGPSAGGSIAPGASAPGAAD